MKTNVLSGIWLVCVIVAVSAAGAQEKWSSDYLRFIGRETDVFHGVSIAGDGSSYFVGVSLRSGRDDRDALVYRVNAVGADEWVQYYGGEKDDHAYAVEATDDGGFVVAGVTYSFGHDKGSMFLIKIDADDRMEWSRIYTLPNRLTPRGIIEDKDGYFLTVGTSLGDDGDKDGFVAAFSSQNGQLVWFREKGGDKDDELFALIRSDDGGFLAAGYSESSGAGGEDGILIKMHRNGQTEWDRYFGKTLDDRLFGVCQSSNGDYYYVAGKHTVSETEDIQSFVAKVDKEGNYVLHKDFGGPCTDRAAGVYSCGANLLLPVSTKSYGTNDRHIMLLKLDSALSTISSTELPGIIPEEWPTVDVDPEGSVRVAGQLMANDFASIAVTGGKFVTRNGATPSNIYHISEPFTCIPSLETVGFQDNIGGFFVAGDEDDEALLAFPSGGWDSMAVITSPQFDAMRDSVLWVRWSVKYPNEVGSSWRENNKTWVSLCDSEGEKLYTVGYKPNRIQDLHTSPDLWLTRNDGSPSACTIAEAKTHRKGHYGEGAEFVVFEMRIGNDGTISVACDMNDGEGKKTYIEAHDASYDHFSSLHVQYKTGKPGEGHYSLVFDELSVVSVNVKQ